MCHFHISYKYLSKSISNIKEGHWGGGWVYKSTGDLAAAKEMYDKYSEVSEPWDSRRNIVVDRKQPRSILVQANTRLVNEKLELVQYEPNPEGLVR